MSVEKAVTESRSRIAATTLLLEIILIIKMFQVAKHIFYYVKPAFGVQLDK
jgi:hypothetical protein